LPRSLAAHHDDERACLGPARAARHRRIEMAHAEVAQACGMVARFARLDGRHIDEERATRHRLRRALIEQNVFDHGACFEHADDHVGDAGGGRRIVVNDAAQSREALRLVARTIPDMDNVPGFAQAPRHWKPHGTDTQHGDDHKRLPRLMERAIIGRGRRELLSGGFQHRCAEHRFHLLADLVSMC
jgi:hypothetical protein